MPYLGVVTLGDVVEDIGGSRSEPGFSVTDDSSEVRAKPFCRSLVSCRPDARDTESLFVRFVGSLVGDEFYK